MLLQSANLHMVSGVSWPCCFVAVPESSGCLQLMAEYGRMPASAGRTLRERQRKAEVEQRLEAIDRGASLLRLQLKRLISRK